MKELLDEFVCTITKENRTITLTYCHPTFSHSGTCVYESHSMKGISKPIVQNFIVMVSCDMGDVIEYIHQKIGLTEKDFNDVNELIRSHSRIKAEQVDQDPRL
jgi:hypothetical protein